MPQDDKTKSLRVVVHYAPAAEPFRKNDVEPTMTVGQLRAEVLDAFGLKEGAQPDGSNIVYTLHLDKRTLDNMAETLGALAEHGPVLQFKLAQQITQGDA